RADRRVLEQLAVEGRGEREDADDLLRRGARPPRADAAVDRDVSRAEVERRPDTLVYRAAGAPRLGRAPTSAVQAQRRNRVVREVRHEASVHVGEGAGRGQEGD